MFKLKNLVAEEIKKATLEGMIMKNKE